MALPSQLVDVIFGRMLARYGSAWLAKWAHVPLEAVRADWAEQLDNYGLVSINHGLMHLPEDFPPTAAQFRRICNGRPDPQPLAIERPKANPQRVADLIATARAALIERTKKRPFKWAFELQEREKAGERLSPAQMSDWRAALEKAPVTLNTPGGVIPYESLPPGMRAAIPEPQREEEFE
jgi:hypothetical protein